MKPETLSYASSPVAVDRHTRVWVSAGGVVGFALLTAVGAQIAIPLPGTPVPITLQTLFVLLAGITLGARLGTASMVLYLLLGSVGYHVFALGHWGLSPVFGATGGYLMGFALAQPVIGALARPGRQQWRRVFAAVVVGNLIIFAAGLVWLSLWLGSGLWETLAMGLFPFVPGLAAKTLLATTVGGMILPSARRLFNA